jgi:hypothetical protein
MDIDNINITVRPSDKGDTKAIVNISYDDIEINGFRISKSKYDDNELWVQPPAYPSGGKYHKIFFLNNEAKWKQLEEKIIASYIGDTSGVPNLDIDDINF